MDNLSGSGGTNLLAAVKKAIGLPKAEGTSRSLVILTDGYIGLDREAVELVRRNLGEANLFAFGIGSSVNRFLIEGLARAGRGEAFVATSPAEGRNLAADFIDYVGTPVLTDIEVAFHGLDARDVLPEAQPDLFLRRPVRITGRFRGEPRGTVEISGQHGGAPWSRTIDLSETAREGENIGILWAREMVRRLEDDLPFRGKAEVRPQIVELGLRYRLLTSFTSFVAVDEVIANERPDGTVEVKQPLPMPKGVGPLAVGGGVPGTPEPGEIGLLALVGLVLGLAWYRSRRRAS